MNYYPHHIGDYAKDTAHLTLLQHGAYRLLLDHVYATEKPLPSAKAELYRICRAATKADRDAVDYVVGKFFPDGTNPRASEELAKAGEKSAKARGSANRRWHSEGTAKAMRTHSEGNAIPITNNQEPRTNKSDGVEVEGISKAVTAVDRKNPEHLRAVTNPAWMFNLGEARLQARRLVIDPSGKTLEELKDAIAAKLGIAKAA